MAVTVETRPEKQIGTRLKSFYNASGGELPTSYTFSNNLFPLNQRDSAYTVVGITNQGGRSLMEVSGADYTAITGDDKFAVNAWVTIVADDRTFVGQVVSFEGSPDILLSIPYDSYFASASTIEFNWYAKDYQVLVNVYVGLNPSHPSYASQPNELIAQKSVSSFLYDSGQNKNLDSFSITGLIKNKIDQYFSDINSSEINLDQFTQFRLEYAEIYKEVNPLTGRNELYDGTNFQSDWELQQPTFTQDDFNCSGAALTNEDFATDLSGWAAAAFPYTSWSYNTGAAQVTVSNWGKSNRLQQSFAYQIGARYKIDYNIETDFETVIDVHLISSTGDRVTINRSIVNGSQSVSFTFQADQIFGNDPTDIGFYVNYSSDSGNNVIRMLDFSQSQPNEGCLPYLSSVYAVRQFRSTYGGSMGDLQCSLDSNGQFLTNAESLIIKDTDINPEISFVIDSNAATGDVSVRITVSYNDGNTEVYYTEAISSGEGLYRINLSAIQNEITSYTNTYITTVTNAYAEAIGSNLSFIVDFDEGTFESCPCGNTEVNPDSIGSVTIETDSTEDPYEGLQSAKISASFDFTDVETNWNRFAHGNKHTVGLLRLNGNPQVDVAGTWDNEQAGEVAAVKDTFRQNASIIFDKDDPALYSSTTNTITTVQNLGALYGVYSTDTYDTYRLMGEMFSSDTDDDVISYVISFYVDGSGVEHTLSLCATTGGVLLDANPAYIVGDSTTDSFLAGLSNNVNWAIVVDFGKSGARQVASYTSSQTHINWDDLDQITETFKFTVDRIGDSINVDCEWNLPSGLESNTFEIDLNSAVDLQQFSGANYIGFCFFSQSSGGFKNIEFYDLGGGFVGDRQYSLEAGVKYTLSAWVKSTLYTNNDLNTFISLGFFDNTDTLIEQGEQYYSEFPEYTRIATSYTPSSDINAKIGIYKGGTDSTKGVQVLYIDSMDLYEEERILTPQLPVLYKKAKTNCYGYSLKWLNQLGGIDYYTFEGAASHNIEFQEGSSYKKEVLGNWDTEFINGGGINYEQYIKFNKVINLSSGIVNKQTAEFLANIKHSINVKMYIDEISDYITVLIDKNSFQVYNDRKNYYRVTMNAVLPDEYVQTA